MAKGPVTRAEFDRLTKRLEAFEKVVTALGAWVASKQRAEAQAKLDQDKNPVIQERDDTGEVWLKSS